MHYGEGSSLVCRYGFLYGLMRLPAQEGWCWRRTVSLLLVDRRCTCLGLGELIVFGCYPFCDLAEF